MTGAASLDHARQVRNRRRDELLDRFQAVGLGIGKQDAADGGGYVIVVYLDSAPVRPMTPVSVDGVPVRFDVSGPIQSLRTTAG